MIIIMIMFSHYLMARFPEILPVVTKQAVTRTHLDGWNQATDCCSTWHVPGGT